MPSLPSVDAVSETPRQKNRTPQVAVDQTVCMDQGYMPRRVDVKLPPLHRKILHDKLRILQDEGAKLKDGTEVSDKTKAILWILENEVVLS